MTVFRWSELKSARLKRTRGLSFEELIQLPLIQTVRHPTRPLQRLVLFERKGYIWAAPALRVGDEIFLKTLYPSRKYTKLYRRGELKRGELE